MGDDQKNDNPLETPITKLRDLVQTTETEIEKTQRELAEAEENGNLEAFLSRHDKTKKPQE